MSYDKEGGKKQHSVEAGMVKADPFSELRYVGAFAIIGGIGAATWVAIIRWGDFGSIVALLST